MLVYIYLFYKTISGIYSLKITEFADVYFNPNYYNAFFLALLITLWLFSSRVFTYVAVNCAWIVYYFSLTSIWIGYSSSAEHVKVAIAFVGGQFVVASLFTVYMLKKRKTEVFLQTKNSRFANLLERALYFVVAIQFSMIILMSSYQWYLGDQSYAFMYLFPRFVLTIVVLFMIVGRIPVLNPSAISGVAFLTWVFFDIVNLWFGELTLLDGAHIFELLFLSICEVFPFSFLFYLSFHNNGTSEASSSEQAKV